MVAGAIVFVVSNVLFYTTLVLMLWGFVHAAIQGAEAFAAIGGVPKWGWLLILGIGLLLAFLTGYGSPRPMGLFQYVGFGAAMYYLLETRTGLRDIAEGRW